MMLRIKCQTWYKDSHSLFDYESNKINESFFEFSPCVKGINFFRKKHSKCLNSLDADIFAIDSFKMYHYEP